MAVYSYINRLSVFVFFTHLRDVIAAEVKVLQRLDLLDTVQGGDVIGGEAQLGDVADLGVQGGQARDLVVGEVHHTKVRQGLD